MKKYAIISLIFIFILGCGKYQKNNDVFVKINNYEISKSEFDELYKSSSFNRPNSPESKKEFLNNLINQKLILQYAQEKRLDKEKDFLKSVERFWEQNLLKIAIDKKTKELARSVSVDDRQIKEAYDGLVKEGKVDKPYDQAYSQIKWDIIKLKESQRLNDWLSDLRKKSKIEVKYHLLK